MTVSLASRYRPRRLSDVVGQRHATSVLKRAIEAGTLPQQILFSGGSGLGKTTLARCVAAALLCESRTESDACGVCESCKDISTPGRIHPDVVEFDAASNGQKEQIKELAARAATAPQRGSHRVYIIDEAHGLSLGGGQAFLKLLEEPPPHVIFMLATTDPDKMLRTNRGRCIEFELTRPTDAEIADRLVHIAGEEGWDLPSDAAQAVISATDPALGLRGLLMTLEKLSDTLAWGVPPSAEEVASLLGLPPSATVGAIVAAIDAHDRQGVLAAVAAARMSSSDGALRRALCDALRARMFADASPLNVWRFEQVVATPHGDLWTDVVCCRLAAPELAPDVVALAAHAQEASQRLADLAAALASAPKPTVVHPSAADTPSAQSRQQPAAVRATSARQQTSSQAKGRSGATQAVSSPTPPQRPDSLASPASRPAREVPKVQPTPLKATDAQPAAAPASSATPIVADGGSPAASGTVDAVIAALSVSKATAAKAAVKAAKPVVRDSTLVLDPPTPALRARLEEHRDPIRTAAASVGLKVSIVRPAH